MVFLGFAAIALVLLWKEHSAHIPHVPRKIADVIHTIEHMFCRCSDHGSSSERAMALQFHAVEPQGIADDADGRQCHCCGGDDR